MNTLVNCPRNFFWGHEIGLSREATGQALRFGSAWHRAMEARWKGNDYSTSLALAIPEGIDLDPYACATLAGLLAGYYDHYGPIETIGRSEPEQEFSFELCPGWLTQGKIDNIGLIENMTHALVESKTTSDSVDPNSDYWLRLRFNLQVFQYYDAATRLGYDISEVYYDVVKKPAIKPYKSIPELDAQGRKIVIGNDGKRVYATKRVKVTAGKGKKVKTETKEVANLDKPRQSPDLSQGQYLKHHPETPDEYCDRVWRDTVARPSFYFCRREIPILEDEVAQFLRQRMALVKVVEHYRSQEFSWNGFVPDNKERDHEAWPRNVSTHTCNFCSYKSFCLTNNPIDINHLPEGYSIKPFNPELSYATTPEETESAA